MTVKGSILIETLTEYHHPVREGNISGEAYEKSAYAFSMQVHPLKPTRKWVIAVKQDVVSLGFPASAAENVILNGCKVLMRQEARLVLAASPIDPDGFEVWKQTVQVVASCVVAPVPAAASPVMEPPLHLPLHPLFHPPFLPSDSVATDLRTASIVLTSRQNSRGLHVVPYGTEA